MNQENIANFIKEIRKKNNLTQKDLAKKYGVTYQAVSKWENGKNIPDISLLKQISKDFNVNIEDILEGNTETKKKNKKIRIIFLIIMIMLIIVLIVAYIIRKTSNFEFKTITSSCSEFTLSGSIAYNSSKSSIYITNIDYCDNNDNTIYKEIECTLYETDNNIKTKISTKKEENITLNDFLKELSFHIDNYKSKCKKLTNNSLHLEINAKNINNEITNYKVPLSLDQKCK